MLYGLPKYGNGIGLHRILTYLEHSGIDRSFFSNRSIIVTGSNGKGSTSNFISSALENMGYSVSLFTSPHLFDVSERFYSNGLYIEIDVLNALIDKGLGHSNWLKKEYNDQLGEFELLFIAAIEWFKEQDTDYFVWEAGIGGRYDPTRIIGANISALTSVELEHTNLLGSTLELIAYDKIDAIRNGGNVVISDIVPSSLYKRISSYCEIRDLDCTFLDKEYSNVTTKNCATHQDYSFTNSSKIFSGRLSSLGRYQLSNALCASHCISLLTGTQVYEVMQNLETTEWAGRLECISEKPSTWIDVGHTPEGITFASQTLSEFLNRDDIIVVFGVSDDKEHAEISNIVQNFFDNFIITKAYKNGYSAKELSLYFNESNIIGIEEQIENAVSKARSIALNENKSIVVLGGLFLAIEFKHTFNGKDPQELNFF